MWDYRYILLWLIPIVFNYALLFSYSFCTQSFVLGVSVKSARLYIKIIKPFYEFQANVPLKAFKRSPSLSPNWSFILEIDSEGEDKV